MRCPFCNHEDTAVKDTRPSEDASSVRRRRQCPDCLSRFTTVERVHLRELLVKKKDGRIENFDREKLTKSLRLALHKRPVDDERIERVISGIVRQFEASGETEIPSPAIGELIMTALLELDPVAYVRFASIYRDFHEAQDFEKLIGKLDNSS
ncbi:MAG: transcriptional regulator NrdR [Alphaproteobacteria bacterium]|nr:transcriptional regulator NrdR [Alphaproteobacteria bacterium]